MNEYKKIFLCLSLTLLACSIISCKYGYKDYRLNDSDKIEQWNKHRKFLLDIKNYKNYGSIICVVYGKKVRLQFFFQEVNQKYYQIILTDPIGFNNIQINVSKNGEYFIHKDIKNNFRFHNFEKLMKQSTNERILIKNFRDWLIGLPGTATNFHLNRNSFIKKIYYAYNNTILMILYKSYYSDIIPFLPKVIEVHYGKDIYLYIKVYKWIIQ